MILRMLYAFIVPLYYNIFCPVNQARSAKKLVFFSNNINIYKILNV